ncbi:MAG: tetratricopeptide repeat protein [Bacteroidetes bacterium]|nr:tetratricopeptide repeat protein [Bacteroidota bacterium]
MTLTRRLVLLLAFVLVVSAMQAQKTAVFSDPARDFKEALEIYDQQKYNIAYNRFYGFIEHYEEVDIGQSGLLLADAYYYKASCAAEQDDPKTEDYYLSYIDRFKGHSFNNVAYYDLGNWYFKDRQYNAALDYYNRVDAKALNKRYYDEFSFKRGFCYFSLKQFDTARSAWTEIVRDREGDYYYEANYYYGMAAYYDADYDEAEASFQKVETRPRYKNVVPYYISQIKFLKNDYQGVISYAVPLIQRSGLKYKSDVNQLIGQSYFELEDYSNAVIYLTEFEKRAKNVTKEDYYQLGYSQYQNGDYEGAVKSFKELNRFNSALAQNALFLTGNAYLRLNDKEQARTALQRAGSMNFDVVIVEESKFSFAKLSYELGYNNEALVSLRKFIVNYPQSKYQEEANEILADLLLQTRNYDEALSIIEQMPAPSAKIKEAYQLMAYHKAISLYNDGRLNLSLEAFNKAERYTPDKSLLTLTKFWRGDIFHRKSNYQKSIAEMNQFLGSNHTINTEHTNKVNKATGHYVQGYNYYKLDDNEKAGASFEAAAEALKNSGNDEVRNKLLPDALLRTADCYFLRKKYSISEGYYDEVIRKGYDGSDYAYYQKGILKGLDGQLNEKIDLLKRMRTAYPESVLADDAIYEIGNTYISVDRTAMAIDNFKQLIREYPDSEWKSAAYLKLGLIYFNQDDFPQALTNYKNVVSEFPRTTASSEALIAIRDVYIAMGNPQGYINYLNQVPGSGVTVSEQDSVLYLSAENMFTNGEYDKALTAFDDYLLRFPNGYFSLPSHFYRGECHFSFQNFNKSIIDYDYVLARQRSRFTERSLQRGAGINFYYFKKYREALELYLDLLGQASTEDNRFAAILGIMRCNYQLKDYRATIEYTNRVIGDEAYSEQQQSEAYFYRAKAYWNTGNKSGAINDFNIVLSRVSNEWAAESTYFIALHHYENGQLDDAENMCKEFVRNYPSYAILLVRTYLLRADIYIAKDDLFKAKATVQSILNNYTADDEWRALAVAKYNEIEQLEAGRSKIVLPDPGDTNDQLKFDE